MGVFGLPDESSLEPRVAGNEADIAALDAELDTNAAAAAAALAGEAEARADQDAALDGAIDDEGAARIAGDESLATQLGAEIQRSTAADQVITDLAPVLAQAAEDAQELVAAGQLILDAAELVRPQLAFAEGGVDRYGDPMPSEALVNRYTGDFIWWRMADGREFNRQGEIGAPPPTTPVPIAQAVPFLGSVEGGGAPWARVASDGTFVVGNLRNQRDPDVMRWDWNPFTRQLRLIMRRRTADGAVSPDQVHELVFEKSNSAGNIGSHIGPSLNLFVFQELWVGTQPGNSWEVIRERALIAYGGSPTLISHEAANYVGNSLDDGAPVTNFTGNDDHGFETPVTLAPLFDSPIAAIWLDNRLLDMRTNGWARGTCRAMRYTQISDLYRAREPFSVSTSTGAWGRVRRIGEIIPGRWREEWRLTFLQQWQGGIHRALFCFTSQLPYIHRDPDDKFATIPTDFVPIGALATTAGRSRRTLRWNALGDRLELLVPRPEIYAPGTYDVGPVLTAPVTADDHSLKIEAPGPAQLFKEYFNWGGAEARQIPDPTNPQYPNPAYDIVTTRAAAGEIHTGSFTLLMS